MKLWAIQIYEVCLENSRIYRVKIFQSYLEAIQPCHLQNTPLYSVCTAASTDSKPRPFSADLSFGNRKKSAGARSGEYGGCGRTVVACLAKKSRTRNDECESTLSCWSIHRFSHHASGLFFLTASRRRCITSR